MDNKRNYLKEAWGDQWETRNRNKRALGFILGLMCLGVLLLYYLMATRPDLFQ